jgi:UDP-N-acetylglucosamine/UDP-N-acetylgalactosamine diphosphorylase
MSTKVAAKTDDLEKVGNLCLSDGRLSVIEYSDFPEELARARTADGERKFDLGNLAIHLLDVAFVERIASSRLELPFHRAEKKVAWTDAEGVFHDPTTPNAIKLEAFIFDALPLATNPLLFTIDRCEEFSPVKNASGADSVETSTRDQVRRAARWLERGGVSVPRTAEGEPTVTIEIASSYALEASDVEKRVTGELRLSSGDELYLE